MTSPPTLPALPHRGGGVEVVMTWLIIMMVKVCSETCLNDIKMIIYDVEPSCRTHFDPLAKRHVITNFTPSAPLRERAGRGGDVIIRRRGGQIDI